MRSTLGRISLTANSSVVCPISVCCSLKSSGVKTSDVWRSSRRKEPPAILDFGIAVVAIWINRILFNHRYGEASAANQAFMKPSCASWSRLPPPRPIHEAPDAILQMHHIEVYKQCQRITTQLQVRKDLCLMDRS